MQTHSTRKGWQAFRTASTQPSRVISGSKVGFNFARNLLPANEREKFGGTFLRRNLMTRIHRWAKYSKNLYHHRPFRSFLSHESFDERLLDYLFTRCLEKSLFFFLSCIVRELDQLKVEEFKYPGIPRITKHLNCTVLWITLWKNASMQLSSTIILGWESFYLSFRCLGEEKPNWFENRLLESRERNI